MTNTGRMRTWLRLAIGGLLAVSTQGATVLSITGPTTSAPIASANQAFVVSFNLSQPLMGVSLLADISCISCSGAVYLMAGNLGPSSSAGDLLAAFAYSGSPTLFSSQDLATGTYFVVLANTAGSTIWNATAYPVLFQSSGATRGSDFTSAAFSPGFPPQSTFAAGLGDVFKYSNSATASVPEPGTMAMVIAGVAMCIFNCRKLVKPQCMRSRER